MKKILLFLVAAVLLPTGTARADLIVNEYVTGEKVTFDDATGLFWYWNLEDFVNKTYYEQITAIDNLGTYGNIAGGWHMASHSEMLSLFPYEGDLIISSFDWPPDTFPNRLFWGRYNVNGYFGISHYCVIIHADGTMVPMGINSLDDIYTEPRVGAWVSSGASVVPAPPAVVLAMTGILGLSVAGVKLRKFA